MKNKIGGLLISKINFLSGRVFTKLMKSTTSPNINHAQGKILFVLSKKSEMSINDLCTDLSLSKSTLTSMLDRLYLNGYISKKVSKIDKRITLISITDKAIPEINIYKNTVSKMEQIYYKNFTDKEIEQFENYLDRVYKNLEEID
jgi:DNA-binding MarR family transcriptional regulator